MKKNLLLLIWTLILSGCATTDVSSIDGNWIDKETEFSKIIFTKSSGIIWMESSDGKSKINQTRKGNFVTINNKEYPIIFSTKKDEILIGKRVFIRENNSLKKQFQGAWKNDKKNIFIEVTLSNGGILWDIKKGENKPERYYPKKTEQGFTFTYDNEQLFFVLEKGYIEDSKGLKYYKVKS